MYPDRWWRMNVEDLGILIFLQEHYKIQSLAFQVVHGDISER